MRILQLFLLAAIAACSVGLPTSGRKQRDSGSSFTFESSQESSHSDGSSVDDTEGISRVKRYDNDDSLEEEGASEFSKTFHNRRYLGLNKREAQTLVYNPFGQSSDIEDEHRVKKDVVVKKDFMLDTIPIYSVQVEGDLLGLSSVGEGIPPVDPEGATVAPSDSTATNSSDEVTTVTSQMIEEEEDADEKELFDDSHEDIDGDHFPEEDRKMSGEDAEDVAVRDLAGTTISPTTEAPKKRKSRSFIGLGWGWDDWLLDPYDPYDLGYSEPLLPLFKRGVKYSEGPVTTPTPTEATGSSRSKRQVLLDPSTDGDSDDAPDFKRKERQVTDQDSTTSRVIYEVVSLEDLNKPAPSEATTTSTEKSEPPSTTSSQGGTTATPGGTPEPPMVATVHPVTSVNTSASATPVKDATPEPPMAATVHPATSVNPSASATPVKDTTSSPPMSASRTPEHHLHQSSESSSLDSSSDSSSSESSSSSSSESSEDHHDRKARAPQWGGVDGYVLSDFSGYRNGRSLRYQRRHRSSDLSPADLLGKINSAAPIDEAILGELPQRRHKRAEEAVSTTPAVAMPTPTPTITLVVPLVISNSTNVTDATVNGRVPADQPVKIVHIFTVHSDSDASDSAQQQEPTANSSQTEVAIAASPAPGSSSTSTTERIDIVTASYPENVPLPLASLPAGREPSLSLSVSVAQMPSEPSPNPQQTPAESTPAPLQIPKVAIAAKTAVQTNQTEQSGETTQASTQAPDQQPKLVVSEKTTVTMVPTDMVKSPGESMPPPVQQQEGVVQTAAEDMGPYGPPTPPEMQLGPPAMQAPMQPFDETPLSPAQPSPVLLSFSPNIFPVVDKIIQVSPDGTFLYSYRSSNGVRVAGSGFLQNVPPQPPQPPQPQDDRGQEQYPIEADVPGTELGYNYPVPAMRFDVR